MSAPPVVIGDVIAGKYVVERVIGEGGMGVVLAARHLELDQRVAIKFLLPEIAEQGMAAERFRREARAAARIRGTHVCRVLDVGTLESGIPFMVMEYLEGRDLASELEQRGKLPVDEAVGYVLQACEALAEAHANGVIHRDLKPANLFLEACADGSRRIKVLDFGVSKSLIEGTAGRLAALTKTSSLVGSPLYMSPEQLDSARDVDARTDVWALGVVLYELIAGQTPFNGDTIPQLVTAVLHDPPRPLASSHVTAPSGLEDVLGRSMSKPRGSRYASIAEFVFALMPFAPPHAAGTAGRVSRLLATTEPLAPPSAASASSSDSARVNVADPVATPLAWGSQSDGSASRRVRTGLLVLFALLVVGGGYFALRGSFGARAVNSSPASIATPGAAAHAPAIPPPSESTPTAAEVKTAIGSAPVTAGSGVEQAKGAIADAPSTPPTSPLALPPSAAKTTASAPPPQPTAASTGKPAVVPTLPADSTQIARPRPRMSPEPEPVRPVKPASASAPNGLSDFGGRR